MEQIVQFLIDLKSHNEREWFEANKPRYQKSKQLFDDFVEQIILNLQKDVAEIKGLEAKDCVYRIYRDVRFSTDKSPYKTHFGAYIVGGGRKSGRSGFYIHIDPDGSFLGGGVYQPENNKLKMIRQEIYNFPEEFLSVINTPDFKNSFELYDKDKLKRPPKGFDDSFEHIDLLKYKHYIASKDVPDHWIKSGDLVKNVVGEFRKLIDLNNFLNQAMEHE
jgi:uncharacterized protein (TIGR02453 family)